MCYVCDDFYMKPESKYMLHPNCLDTMGPEVIITYHTAKWMTVVEVKTANSLENLAYAFQNETLAKMGPQDVLDVLLYNFKPLIQKYPTLANKLAKLISNEYEAKPVISSPPGFLNKQELYEALKKQATKPIYNTSKYVNDYAAYQTEWEKFEKYNPDAAKNYVGEPKKFDDYWKSYASVGGRRQEVDELPGLTEMVKYPGKKYNSAYGQGKPLTMTLEKCIITLNDYDKWTREQIADWLETLDVDITFRSKDAEQV